MFEFIIVSNKSDRRCIGEIFNIFDLLLFVMNRRNWIICVNTVKYLNKASNTTIYNVKFMEMCSWE